MIGLAILILVIMVCLYGLMLWCVVQWYNAGRRRAAEKRELAELRRQLELVPRDGYDYPTTLVPQCEGAADRGPTEYKAWTKKYEQDGR